MSRSHGSSESHTDAHLFASLYPGLRRFAAVVRPVGTDPDDLVQEALVRALRLGPLSSRDDPGAYLRTAIVRVASNQRRSSERRDRAVRRIAAVPDASDPTPTDLADLRRLAPVDRAILYLRVVEGWSYAEVATSVERSEPAVRARASRALRRLRVDLVAEQEEMAGE